MTAEFPRCAVCRVAVEPAQNVVFRRDGRVQHAVCPAVICPVCARPIKPTDPIRRDGEAPLHSNCWLRRARTGAAGRMPDLPNLRQRIVTKLLSGILPQHLPEKMRSGFGGDDVCDACDDPILAAQPEYIYELADGRILRLHIGCSGLWQSELLRRGVKRDQ